MGKSAKGEQQVTEYTLSMHIGLGVQVDAILEIAIGEKSAWKGDRATESTIQIDRPTLFGGIKKEGGVAGYVYFLPGGALQTVPTSLAKRFGLTRETCPGFRGISSLFFIGDIVGDAGWVPLPEGVGGGTPDGWTPPGGGSACPAPWMPVLLANDDRTGPGRTIIHGDLKRGDFVWTQHETSREWGAFEVAKMVLVPDVERWNLHLTDGRELCASADHRLATQRGWVQMKNLRRGDLIRSIGGDMEVLDTRPRDRGEVCRTTVKSARTYLMDGLLSHNLKAIDDDMLD